MSANIKQFADQFRTIKTSIETKMAQANAKLANANNTFGASVDKAMAYIDNVNQYSAELEGLTRELTNGGPALDDTFPAPAPASTDHDPNALIAAQAQLGRKHPSQP